MHVSIKIIASALVISEIHARTFSTASERAGHRRVLRTTPSTSTSIAVYDGNHGVAVYDSSAIDDMAWALDSDLDGIDQLLAFAANLDSAPAKGKMIAAPELPQLPQKQSRAIAAVPSDRSHVLPASGSSKVNTAKYVAAREKVASAHATKAALPPIKSAKAVEEVPAKALVTERKDRKRARRTYRTKMADSGSGKSVVVSPMDLAALHGADRAARPRSQEPDDEDEDDSWCARLGRMVQEILDRLKAMHPALAVLLALMATTLVGGSIFVCVLRAQEKRRRKSYNEGRRPLSYEDLVSECSDLEFGQSRLKMTVLPPPQFPGGDPSAHRPF